MEEYRALETQLLANQRALIAEMPAKWDGWRREDRANPPQKAHLTQLLSRLNRER
jgi:hypothetical protein